jgi:hypothetical protein
MFLRNELCSNNLADFQLKKGLEHLGAVREKFLAITDRFAAPQAQWLNVHVDFPVLQRLARPVQVGTVKVPGIKIHDTRIIRLMEVLLDGGGVIAGRRATELYHAVVTRFHLTRRAIRAQSTPLRSPQAPRARPPRTRWPPSRVWPYRQGPPRGAPLPALPSAPLRAHSPTAFSISARSQGAAPTVPSKPPTTKPMRRLKSSFTYSRPPERDSARPSWNLVGPLLRREPLRI